MSRLSLKLFLLLFLFSSKVMALGVGDLAPDFKAHSTNDKVITLSDFAKSTLVLYFYPKSFTPACTKEACSLRDGYKLLAEKGVTVLGVSADNLETQKKFKEEHKLPFELLADTDKSVVKAYDASWGPLTKRVTYIIRAGKIIGLLSNVEVENHAAQILQFLASQPVVNMKK